MAITDDSIRGLFRIGEFSKVSGISIKALRHWDDMGLLKPVIVDSESKYRYYRLSQLQDVDRLNMIKALGIPMSNLMNWAKEAGHESISDFTGQDYFRHVEETIAQQKAALEYVENFLASQKRRYTYESMLKSRGRLEGVSPSKYYFKEHIFSTAWEEGVREYDILTALFGFPKRCGTHMTGIDWGFMISRQPGTGNVDISLFLESLVATLKSPVPEGVELFKTATANYRSTLDISRDPLWALVHKYGQAVMEKPGTELWVHVCTLVESSDPKIALEFRLLQK